MKFAEFFDFLNFLSRLLVFFITSPIKVLFFKTVIPIRRSAILRRALPSAVLPWTTDIDEHRIPADFYDIFKIKKKIRFLLSKSTIPRHDKS